MKIRHLQTQLNDIMQFLRDNTCFVKSWNLLDDRLDLCVHGKRDLFLSIPYDTWKTDNKEEPYSDACVRMLDYLIYCLIKDEELPYAVYTFRFEDVKDLLVIRPFNALDHHDRLRDAICRYVNDIALAVYCEIPTDISQYVSFQITSHIYRPWNMDAAHLLDHALRNTAAKYPARMFLDLTGLLDPKDPGMDVMALNITLPHTRAVPLITSARVSSNGAAAIFYPGILEKLSQIMQGGFYIVFTGVSEARLHSMSGFHPETALEALRETNAQFPDTLLSRYVYCYDPKKRQIGVYGESKK